jgi:dipeptidyl aminopeptidase/acylaminoacyl peptidase
LLRADSSAVYAPSVSAVGQTGYLLFVRARKLLAQPFDVERLETTGDSFPVVEQIPYAPGTRYAEMSVSENGVLAYRSGSNLNHELVWCDRRGKVLLRSGAPGEYQNLELSPDGKQVALAHNDPQTETADIWLLDLSRDISTPLTFDPALDVRPIWSPEGRQIIFGANRGGAVGIYRKGVSGVDKEELLLKGTEVMNPTCWSRDGRFIVNSQRGLKTQMDLWILPLAGDRQPREYLTSDFSEVQGRLSPDGRWLAYISNESGRYEVYVQPFPAAPGKRTQVSKGGGTHPRWRNDGKELFYLAADGQLMAVAVKAESRFEAGAATELFELRGFGTTSAPASARYPYDVTADGQRFIILKQVEDASTQNITVVLNWTAALKR